MFLVPTPLGVAYCCDHPYFVGRCFTHFHRVLPEGQGSVVDDTKQGGGGVEGDGGLHHCSFHLVDFLDVKARFVLAFVGVSGEEEGVVAVVLCIYVLSSYVRISLYHIIMIL